MQEIKSGSPAVDVISASEAASLLLLVVLAKGLRALCLLDKASLGVGSGLCSKILCWSWRDDKPLFCGPAVTFLISLASPGQLRCRLILALSGEILSSVTAATAGAAHVELVSAEAEVVLAGLAGRAAPTKAGTPRARSRTASIRFCAATEPLGGWHHAKIKLRTAIHS